MDREGWIDVTVPLSPELIRWPGDPPLELERLSDLERGDDSTVSKIRMGLHTGTHVDAPLHFVRGGRTVAEMPLDVVVAPATVIELSDDVVTSGVAAEGAPARVSMRRAPARGDVS